MAALFFAYHNLQPPPSTITHSALLQIELQRRKVLALLLSGTATSLPMRYWITPKPRITTNHQLNCSNLQSIKAVKDSSIDIYHNALAINIDP
ncbi:MAG: hypothetical protein ACI9WS_003350 [Paraglaciecola psychrophila]|jgi:hypothetical protein